MSVRIKKMKQEPSESMNLEEHQNSAAIRTKTKYTTNLDVIKCWIDTVEPSVVNGIITPTIKTYWKVPRPAQEASPAVGDVPAKPARAAEQNLPQALKGFVEYMLEESRIPQSEVRGYMFYVIKPLDTYNKEAIINTPLINIKQCMAFISDRFVLFGGSKEQLTYKVINMDQLKKQMGMGGMYIPEKFHENISENSVTRMDLTTAIANILQVNNERSYPRPKKKGFRDGIVVPKNPNKRWILCFDVIATTDKVNTVLRDKLQMMGDIMNVAPTSKEAKILRSFKPAMDAAIAEADEAPQLVSTEDDDSDVEDIVIPVPKGSCSTVDSDILDEL